MIFGTFEPKNEGIAGKLNQKNRGTRIRKEIRSYTVEKKRIKIFTMKADE